MEIRLLPLFPLSFVLFPGTPLPLHIFEERYKEMMGDIIPGGGEFGVVLAKGEGIMSIGCTAKVDQVVRRYPDGRLDLLAIGQRRFEVTSLNEEKSYLQGGVEFFGDEDATAATDELQQRALNVYRDLLRTERPDVTEEAEPRHAMFSFQIAQYMQDLDRRQATLMMRSEVDRLEFLCKAVPEYLASQARVTLAKRVAPRNGHAKIP